MTNQLYNKKGKVTDIDKTINSIIKNIRIQKGLSQRNLAELLNVTTQQIQKYEKNINRISAGNLIILARNLQIDLNKLLDVDITLEKSSFTLSQEKAIKKFTDLLLQQDEKIVTAINSFLVHMKENNGKE